jgi:hypothetical protein
MAANSCSPHPLPVTWPAPTRRQPRPLLVAWLLGQNQALTHERGPVKIVCSEKAPVLVGVEPTPLGLKARLAPTR